MSKVYLRPLDEVLVQNDEKRAFLLGVATYLKKLNAFASSKKSQSITEYNVGGVISIVEQLETLADTYKTPDSEDLELLGAEDYYKALIKSWFCYQDYKHGLGEVKAKTYFNSDFDIAGTLPLTIGQFLVTLKPAINTYKYEMFKVSHNLLARYSDYIKQGEAFPSVDPNNLNHDTDPSDLLNDTPVDVKELLRSFQTLFRMAKITKQDNAFKALELRKAGNELLKQNRTGAALAKYSEGISIDPNNYVLYSNRGAIYTSLNDLDSAIEDLETATKLNPNYETAWTRLGFIFLAMGKSGKSVEAYSKAIKLADEKKMLPTYLKKLCAALDHAEQRARSNGSGSNLSQYTDPIQSIRAANQSTGSASQSRPQTQGSFPGAFPIPNSQDSGIQEHLNTFFQNISGNGNGDGAQTDPLVATLNGLGTMFSGTGSIQMFGINEQPNQNPQTDQQTQGSTNQQSTRSTPATSTNPPAGTQTNQTQQQPQNSAQPTPQGFNFSQMIQNSLPEGLRSTVGPAITFAINNAHHFQQQPRPQQAPQASQAPNSQPQTQQNQQEQAPQHPDEESEDEVIFATFATGPDGNPTVQTQSRRFPHQEDYNPADDLD